MKFLTAAAFTAASLMCAGSASAGVIFFEGFDTTGPNAYSPLSIAHGATGGTGALPFAGANQPAATAANGNTISTNYSYRVPNGQNGSGQADSMYNEGTWTIATNPQAVHDLWINLPDNTDPFLMVNGAPTPTTGPNAGVVPVAYESGGVSVGAGTYNFSYDLLNICCNANDPGDAHAVSPLQLWYTATDGSTTQIHLGGSIPTGDNWQTVAGSFTLADGGTIRLGLVDDSGVFGGNDFGVDNITLSNAVPEPASWALMILGFGGAGAVLRSRRRQALATA
jgi:hypothetical protein